MEQIKTLFFILVFFGYFSFSSSATIWDVETLEQNVGHTLDTNVDVVFDSNSVPHLIYFSKVNGGTNVSMLHAYLNGTEWDKPVILYDHFSDSASYDPKACIDIDPNGTLCIAYSDSDDGIYYLSKTGVNCSNPYPVDSDGTFLLNDMHVDSNGLLHILYTKIPAGLTIDESELVLAVGKETSFTKSAIRSDGNFQSLSLAVDSQGNDHIAYYDINMIDVLRYTVFDHNYVDDESVEALGASAPDSWGSLSIDVDGNDVPHISYYHISDSDLKYATKPQTAWIKESIDTSGITGEQSSLSIDANGVVHIFYLDRTGGIGKLKYAFRDNGQWSIETIDEPGQWPKYISLDIDSSGRPFGVYDFYVGQNIQYATPAICGSIFHPYPDADIDRDCYVDMYDMAFFALRWAESACGQPDHCSGADLDKKGNVDNNDLSIINESWLDCSMPSCY